jgi:quercetin dioxygenase-like cupin family protein
MPSAIITPNGTASVFDVFGPTIEFLTPPSDADAPYCTVRGVIPAGVHVPLHSHPEPESFYVETGAAQVLVRRDGGFAWMDLAEGDFVHIPGGVEHAHRNESGTPVVELITMAPRLARFFADIARPIEEGAPPPPPTDADLRRMADVAARYGHWLATPEENAAVGIRMG